MRMTETTMKQFATVGAALRLRELDTERAQIMSLFPDLQPTPGLVSHPFAPGNGAELVGVLTSEPVANQYPEAGTRKGKRLHLSPERRAAISLRMRKYWKAKRALKAKKAAAGQ